MRVKNKNKVAWIIIITLFSFLIIIATYQLIEKYLENKLQEYYKSEVEEFLQDKYNRSFNVEFYEKGKEILDVSNLIGFDCNCYCLETDIDEYRFKYYPEENKDIVGCIGVRVEPTDDPYNIKEIVDLEYGYAGMHFFDNYEINIKNMNQKEEIMTKFKDVLPKDYEYDYTSDARKIKINTKESLHDLIVKDTSGNYKSILEETEQIADSYEDIVVIINYKEINSPGDGMHSSMSFNDNLDINQVYIDEYFVEELKGIINNMERVSYDTDSKTKILMPLTINKNKENKIIENLKQLAEKYKKVIVLVYSDYNLEIDTEGNITKNNEEIF